MSARLVETKLKELNNKHTTMKKQLSEISFNELNRIDESNKVSGAFKFKTGDLPIYCPMCGQKALKPVAAYTFLCTACGNESKSDKIDE